MRPVFSKLVLVVLFVIFISIALAQSLTITPEALAFGVVNVGDVGILTTSIGTSVAGGVTITHVALDDDTYFSISSIPEIPALITPIGGFDIEVSFTPSSTGYVSTVLRITVTGYPEQTVNVGGTGFSSSGANMLTYPENFDFGFVNIGDIVGTNLLVRLSPEWLADHTEGTMIRATLLGSDEFSSGDTFNTNTAMSVVFPVILTESDEIRFEIYYSPIVEGLSNAIIEMECDDGNLYHIAIQGTGVSLAPEINLDPNSVVMSMAEGSTSTSFFDVQNTGIEDLDFNINDEELPAWITLSGIFGTVAGGNSLRINVIANASSIPPGDYSYLVYVNSNDPGNPTVNLMITVTVTAVPLLVNFIANPLTGHPPFAVTFTDTSHTDATHSWSNITSWRWDFDNDGVFDSFVQHPTYTYTQPGLYSVRLVATTNTGVVSTKTRENYINAVNSSPQIVMPLNEIPNMVEDTQWGPTDVTYIFNDPDGDPVIITCESSAHLNAIIEFGYLRIIPASNWNGSDIIRIMGVDRFGKGPVQEVLVTVAAVNDAPILSVPSDLYFIRNSHFTVDFAPYIDDPDNTDDQLSIQITSNTAGSQIFFAYTPQPLPNVIGQLSVVFSSLSQAEVQAGFTIHVNDNMGRLIASAVFTMHLLDHFSPQINLTSIYQYAGQTVSFRDGTLGNPDYWLWDFGDGQTSTLQNPQHQFLQAGTYNIRLSLGNTEAGETAFVFIPGMIHLVGTAVTETQIPATWTLLGSPYNLFGGIVIEESATIVIQEDVQVNLFGEEPLLINGSLNANGAVFQPHAEGGFWGGLRFRGEVRNPSMLQDCDIINALLPIDIDGANPSFTNLTISVSDTTNYVAGAAIKIIDSSCSITGAELLNYRGGVVIEEGSGRRSTPTLTNIRVRNSTSTLRTELPPSTGLTITGEANISGFITDNFDTGILIGSEEIRATATPTLTNIRIRNSSNTLRSVESCTGISIKGNAAPSITDVEIDDIAVGVLIENVNSSTRTTPTLTNIRVRNSTSTLRSVTNGIIIRNTNQVTIHDAEFYDFATGILIQADTRAESTPTLTNIRVRNSSNTLRNESIGIDIEGSVAASLNDVEVEYYNTGIKYDMTGSANAGSTPTLTNIRVRNSSNTLRQQTTGAVFTGLGKLIINDMEIAKYGMGLKILAPDTRAESTPTLTNIRVRNSTSTLRNETIGIYLGPNVKGRLADSEVDSLDVGIFIADGNRTVLGRNRIMDCVTGIRASGINPLPITKQLFYLQSEYASYQAMELLGAGPWEVFQNTIYRYPIGVKANNATLNFHSNILWNDDQTLPSPFFNINSTISNSYNDIYYGIGLFPGLGNINVDPCFVSVEDNNFLITRDSPCIDAGSPLLPPEEDGSFADIGAWAYLHRASGIASPRFVVAGTMVNFTNTSLGHDYPETQVVWDIGNDGITDSNNRQFSHVFSTPGLYDVRLRMQSGLLTDETIYERLIVVSANLLLPPSNPALIRDGNDIVMSWNAVYQAEGVNEVPFYIILRSESPDGFYRYRGFSTSSQLPFRDFGAASVDKSFYIVIGFDGSRGELMEYIQRLNSGNGIRSKK